MSKKEQTLKSIISHSKEYGFVFPSSEIYDGLSAFYDYGPNGVELKNNIKKQWWESMVHYRLDVVGLDSAIFMHPKIWKASGHTDAFNDPLIDNKDSKKRYRADELIETYIQKLNIKIEKEIHKAQKRFGENFDMEKFCKTSPRVVKYLGQIETITKKMSEFLENEDFNGLKQLIENLKIVCPVSGTCNWTDIRQFNLMFGTKVGSVADEALELFLRPETAQGIFVNFLNVQKTARMKIPFGIAQIGKAFRNEIIARQFIFRMREFEQMEMQFFIEPGSEEEWFNYWKEERIKWHKNIGINQSNLKFHNHEKLAHYAKAATDIEFKFPFGFKEIEGIHSRTDFDLKNHSNESNKKIQYFDSKLNKNYTPYVVETSIGLDRMFLAILCESYCEEIENNEKRVLLKLPPILAPYKVAILPLVKKDNLPKIAKQIFNKLNKEFNCYYEEKDSIGKRYRRQDAIGTPFCITVDHNTLEDDSVTFRNRDDMSQERVKIEFLNEFINKKLVII
jgi:glycyl-tRNA synthetase